MWAPPVDSAHRILLDIGPKEDLTVGGDLSWGLTKSLPTPQIWDTFDDTATASGDMAT